MSTDAEPDDATDGRPVTEPEDLVLPDDVESTVTAGTPADTVTGTRTDAGDASTGQEGGNPPAG